MYAARCENRLNEAKALCKHGEFLPWVDANCHVKKSQAYKYMKIAAEMPDLLDDSNFHPGGNLPGIKQTFELLNAPDDVKTEVNRRLEAGEDVTVKEIRELKATAERLKKRNLELSVYVKEANEELVAFKDQGERIKESSMTAGVMAMAVWDKNEQQSHPSAAKRHIKVSKKCTQRVTLIPSIPCIPRLTANLFTVQKTSIISEKNGKKHKPSKRGVSQKIQSWRGLPGR